MALTPGTRIGSYEIAEQIGVGGMGEVYRATDAKLGRAVAIKVLPDSVAQDSERLARFDREARTLASLNHPNIAAIYGLEGVDSSKALVMELVEGPTLADRIAQSPIPVDEALGFAKQIAEALEAAHEQGIIHRDLKPANVKVRPDGTVKVLDFGLAKALAPEAGAAASGTLSMSPTITTPAMTQAGMILGTAAYMSPEQARGKAVDRRADIWAFGCVLYEMLTGRRAFEGEDVAETLANVINREPDWTALPASLSPALVTYLRRALQKNPKQRVGDMQDMRLALEGAFETTTTSTLAPEAKRRPVWTQLVPLTIGALVVGGLAVGLATWLLSSRPGAAPLNRFAYDIPAGQSFRYTGRPVMAVAPDGRHMVYNTRDGLYLRAMDTLEARLIPGTEAALTSPFFSPDGQSVAYWEPGTNRLMKIAISGGAPVLIGSVNDNLQGASWAADGTILFGQADGIYRVADTGGTPALVIPVGDGEQFYGPQLLPDGDSVLLSVSAVGGGADRWDTAAIVAVSLRTQERTVLVNGGSDGRYIPTGHLVYALGDGLFGVPFDVESLTVTPGPVPLVQDVARPVVGSSAAGGANFGVADDGTLVYLSGQTVGSNRTLVWADRQGGEETLNAPPRTYLYPRLSPDGSGVALEILDEQQDIWVWNLARETLTRLTFDPGLDIYPVWSPDGRRIAYSSQQGVFWRNADGTGTAEAVAESTDGAPTSFSPDGAYLLFNESQDVSLLSMEGERSSSPLISTEFTERNADVSPDGRWVAYESDDSGRPEIYVRPFPAVEGGRWTVSQGGGTRPLWSRDGRELFYTDGSTRIMAVPIEAGETFTFGNPVVAVATDLAPSTAGRNYDVSADGKRFLIIKLGPDPGPDAGAAGARLIIVQHWTEELKRLVPTE